MLLKHIYEELMMWFDFMSLRAFEDKKNDGLSKNIKNI